MGLLRLVVNYDNLYYTVYEDKPAKTLDTIIAEIGGELGLCGGISLLNACEFIGILVAFCYHHRRQKEINKISNSDEQDTTEV